MLADIGEDEIGRDRRRLVESHLAPLALDVVFLGVAEAAESLKCCFGGMSVRLGSEQLRDVGVGTAFLAIGEERGRAPRHHISCFEFGMGAARGGAAPPGSGRSAGQRRRGPWRIRRHASEANGRRRCTLKAVGIEVKLAEAPVAAITEKMHIYN